MTTLSLIAQWLSVWFGVSILLAFVLATLGVARHGRRKRKPLERQPRVRPANYFVRTSDHTFAFVINGEQHHFYDHEYQRADNLLGRLERTGKLSMFEALGMQEDLIRFVVADQLEVPDV